MSTYITCHRTRLGLQPYMPEAATPIARGCARSSRRRSQPPTRRYTPLQVREFETVEGQEWWHNDARSSQAAR